VKISYNAPVTLSFALLSLVILILDGFSGQRVSGTYFAVYPTFDPSSVMSYVRLISHAAGHANWPHYIGNFTFILLIGPILEEKYGSRMLLEMMILTALVTGILNTLFFPNALMGASGIVFMLILLSSFTNFRAGEIPLTFILIAAIYLTGEIIAAFRDDHISQFAHIIGGACGGLFGFAQATRKQRGKSA